jgi:hypothetical protein
MPSVLASVFAASSDSHACQNLRIVTQTLLALPATTMPVFTHLQNSNHLT